MATGDSWENPKRGEPLGGSRGRAAAAAVGWRLTKGMKGRVRTALKEMKRATKLIARWHLPLHPPPPPPTLDDAADAAST
jgi:hypothetical protein